MKSSFSKKKLNKKIKSVDVNRALKIKKLLKKKTDVHKSEINNNRTSLKDLRRYNDKDEISILSNANLNIIKNLINCANEDFLNDSSFGIINNNNDEQKEKEKSVLSISRWKNNICGYKGSPTHNNTKKKKISKKSNKSNFVLNSNLSDIDFSSEIITSDVRKETIKSQTQINFVSPKNMATKNKIKNKKTIALRHSSSDVNINKFNTKNYEKKTDNNTKSRQRSRSIIFRDNINLSKHNAANISKINISQGLDIEKNKNYKGLLSEIEIMKINEHIHNDINFIHLKKKISKLKRTIQRKSSKKDLFKIKTKISNKSGNSPLMKIKSVEEGNENNNEAPISKDMNNSTNIQNFEKISSNTKLNSSICSKKYINVKDKYRLLIRRKDLYDSIDDEENKEEEIDYYISPNAWYIKIFDCLLFLSSMIYFIFVPFFLSKDYSIIKENPIWRLIFLIIDIIYIIDIVLNFFRAYHNFDENLIRRTKKIFFHYLKTWFILDFIQAIPYFSIIAFLEKYISDNNQFNYNFYGYHNINPRIYIILLVKIIKLYKMFYNNSTLSYIYEILSKNEFFDDHGEFIIMFLVTLIVLNMTTCLFIFLGINSHPSWIIKLNNQDKSYLYIYLVSVYFIIVTITTVGYGDITGETFPEILFQIMLLIIGTIAYSFTISYISNYIIKSNQKSMSFEKNLEILQEIKMHHPNMKNTLYNEVLRNLYNEQLYERKDKHLLFDGLPYSLKNKLIIEMYKPIIKNFVFFKNIDNSDFIVKVVTSLKPLISLKGDIIIQEGDYINEIFFVKKGVIGLNICIDLNDPKLSLKKFLGKNGIGKFNMSYIKSNIVSQTKTFSESSMNALNNLFNRSNNINNNEDEVIQQSENTNLEEIKVIEIRAREHFGDALMFLNERCPIVAKVRTKSAELLILRKMEAIEIYSIYPNIWKRINKKSLHNMEQIYIKIKKLVIELSSRYQINIDDYLNRKKSRSNIKKTELASKDKVSNTGEKVEEKEKEPEKEQEKEPGKVDIITAPEKKERVNSIVIQEKQEKVVEFNENIIHQNNTLTVLDKNENGPENITFLKKNTTNKETILSALEKNSLFKNSIATNKNLNEINDNDNDLKKSNNNFGKPFVKYKTLKLKQKKSIADSQNSKKNSSIYPNALLLDNNTNNSYSNYSSLRNKLHKNTLTKREKILYNAFTNLSTTREKSFQLNSSYDNINSISKNKYIKDIQLQSKIKQVLIDECSKTTFLKNKNNSFLNLPGILNTNVCKTPKSSNRASIQNFKSLVSEGGKFVNNSSYMDNNNNGENIIKKAKTIKRKSQKSENDDGYISDFVNIKDQKEQCISGKLEIKKNVNFCSSRNLIDIRKLRTPILDSRRVKQKNVKKKPEKIDKQLNKISKNIKNTSKNINNPEEFYMQFFNNILAKESKSFKGDDDDNNNGINQNSGNKTKDDINRRSSIAGKNIEDSLFGSNSNKESNININKTAIKRRKSGFNSSKFQ